MNGNVSTQASAAEIAALLRGLQMEVKRLADRIAESLRVVHKAIAGDEGPTQPTVEPDLTRAPKGNFAKVKRYLATLKGGGASIPAIAKATGIPQGSLRNMIYTTRKEDFELVESVGSTENQWKLVDSFPDIFGGDSRCNDDD